MIFGEFMKFGRTEIDCPASLRILQPNYPLTVKIIVFILGNLLFL